MPIGTYTPPPYCKSLYKIFFFHFRCILLQISHKKCFFTSISILGRSGVKAKLYLVITHMQHVMHIYITNNGCI